MISPFNQNSPADKAWQDGFKHGLKLSTMSLSKKNSLYKRIKTQKPLTEAQRVKMEGKY